MQSDKVNSMITTSLAKLAGLTLGLSICASAQNPPCLITFNPQSALYSSTGGTTPVQVTVSDNLNCSWVGPLTASPNIIQVGNAGFFQGSGHFTYTVAANPGPLARTASVTAAVVGLGSTPSSIRPTANYLLQVLQQSPSPSSLFTDVPLTNPFVDYVNLFKANNLTNGCASPPLMFCPDAVATRAQVAVFIARAATGTDNFSFSTVPYFADVPVTHPMFKYIQKLKDLGITSGCATGLFCPDATATRGQVAALMVRGKFPSSITDTTTLQNSQAPYFTDVPAAHPFFPYVQKMKDFGITSGCSATSYCVDTPVTRAQMAVFIIRLFYTPFVTY
jgi:hypothetical protein